MLQADLLGLVARIRDFLREFSSKSLGKKSSR